MSILGHVPAGFKLRPQQEEMLLEIEANWNNADILVLRADVGTGKSLVLRTVAAWQASRNKLSAIITPRVALQEQYQASFKTTPILKGSSRYKCKDKFFPHCHEKKSQDNHYCPGCPYKQAKQRVVESKVGIFNLQSYYLLQQPREVVMVDEAHTLFDLISEFNTVRIWDTKHKLPEEPENTGEVLVWLEKLKALYKSERAKKHDELAKRKKDGWSDKECRKLLSQLTELDETCSKLFRIHNQVAVEDGKLFLEEGQDFYRGRKKKRYLIRPKSLLGLFNPLDAKATKKMILATATMQQIDIERLGWGTKKVLFLDYPSPFEVKDQPILVQPVGNMGWKYKDKNIPKMAQRIRETREKHKDTKGIVHLPYGLAKDLQNHLKEDWVLWHDSNDKEKKLKFFKESADKGTVLIASGMSMGIDMAGSDFGWQAIGKILYPSMADQLVASWYKHDNKWVTWLTTREFIQACGRVNRYYGDKAVTYVWDSALGNPMKVRFGLWQQADKLGYLAPQFKKRFKWA